MTLSAPLICDVSKLFAALGDESRLRILKVLVDAGRPMAQGAVAEAAGLSQANASKHLIHLARVGLVNREPSGNQVLFTPVTPLVPEVCDLVCGFVARRIQDAYSSMS
ncbi:ArsR/SmtB family transcription factor [Mesoterricola sediminis]|uniref:Transcriptional regulator n=1 Tax=Mesoterricola sediminis TaxID=2927980 RepID=A0AA48H4L0_9BACT|nr:metalloregulator ArsR/SmtB family transcription factor [Mesoterricola sediminis]BDU77341.1 transcriptional regulator [Mesoterricola sediminis]